MEVYPSVYHGREEVPAVKAGATPDLLDADLQSYPANSTQKYFAFQEDGCAGADQRKPDKTSDEKELLQKDEAEYVKSENLEVPPTSTKHDEVCSSEGTSHDAPEISDLVHDRSREGQSETHVTDECSEEAPACSTKEKRIEEVAYDEQVEAAERSAPQIVEIQSSYVPTAVDEEANPIGECSPQESEQPISGAYVESPAEVEASSCITEPVGIEHTADESATKESYQSEIKSQADYASDENAKSTEGEYLEGEAAKPQEDNIAQEVAREFEAETLDHTEATNVIEGPCDTAPAKAGSTDTPYADQFDSVEKHDQVAYDSKPSESVEIKDTEVPCEETAVEETENAQSESVIAETEAELDRSAAEAEVDKQAEAEYAEKEAVHERDASVEDKDVYEASKEAAVETYTGAEEQVAAKEEAATQCVEEEAEVTERAEEEAAQEVPIYEEKAEEADQCASTAQVPETEAAAIVHDTDTAAGEQFAPEEAKRDYVPEEASYGEEATLKGEGSYEEPKAMQEEAVQVVPILEKQAEGDGYREIKANGGSVPAADTPVYEVTEPEKPCVEQPTSEATCETGKPEKPYEEVLIKETSTTTTELMTKPEAPCEEKTYQEKEPINEAATTTELTKPEKPYQEGLISEAIQVCEKEVPMTEVFQSKAFENIAEPAAPPQKGSILEKLIDKMTGKHK